MFIQNQKKIIIAGIFFLMICLSCKFYFNTTKDQFTAQKKNASFENGRNLVYTICAGCHMDFKTGKFTGKYLNDLPKIAGHLYSANLTHAAQYGMPDKYSDAELFYLFKRGIAKNGKFMPYMMKPMMADEDVNDMIVYLRSGDAALSADDMIAGKTKINLIGKAGIRFLMGPTPYNKGILRPAENNPVEYGKYLVGVIGCYHCHSRKTTGLDFLDPENTKGYLLGGIKLKDPNGKRIYAPNLTPDNETGIGNYTVKEFSDAIRKGIGPSGRELSPPMDKFTELTNKQVNAIFAYLKSRPAVKHQVK
ncbi:MAG: cytochrome c [Ferruginibacter sp.]